MTLARALLAQHRMQRSAEPLRDAIGLLARLLEAAESGGRAGSAIEILILLALAHQLGGDLSAALSSLDHALTLAASEGYVRVFVNEGAPMAALLEAATARGLVSARRLLPASGRNYTSGARGVPHPGLPERLSDREREVLRLLGTEMSGPEIARQLVVSLNTVRTHTKNIYTKLGVNNRRAAVLRAADLDVLASGGQEPS